ncbi:MAG: ECF transporter S component [Brevefilum sp.]|nr:ECF transporter S component [Brevefilum sp.]MDW7753741.1 ECF transporter S component [Brevefilum sp.]
MVQERTRKIVITGVLSAISIFLGMTRLGFIPWVSGASLTIMQVPVIIGAVLEGPIVGFVIGLVFGVFSLIQAAVAPTGPADVWFTNPLLSILPRLFIGPVAWLIYRGLKRWEIPALIAAGVGGSLTNTVLVLGMVGVLKLVPWAAIPPIILANGAPESIVSAVLVVAVVGIWKQIGTKGEKSGSEF